MAQDGILKTRRCWRNMPVKSQNKSARMGVDTNSFSKRFFVN